MVEAVSHETRAIVATMCWFIWKTRNEKVWNNRNTSSNGMLYSAKKYLTQWKNTQSRHYEALPQATFLEDGESSWVKSHEESVKGNVDAALFQEEASFGTGLVARDCNGELIQAKTILTVRDATPEMVDVMAIKEALSWIEFNMWPEVTVESDCLVAVQAIRSNIPMISSFGVVVEEYRMKLSHLNKV